MSKKHHAPDVAALQSWLVDEYDEGDDREEWEAWCPLHSDQNPSASFNFEKGVWHCFKGCPDGPIGELLHRLENLGLDEPAEGDLGGFEESRAEIINLEKERRLRRRGERAARDLPGAGEVRGWCEYLTNDRERREKLLSARGLSQETLREYEIGFDTSENAYTIPMRDEDGDLVNVKWYRLEPSEDGKKMWGVPGCNQARLYPIDKLDMEGPVVLSEGEMDTLLLRQYGFPAITGTGGAGTWKQSWVGAFKGREVYLCRDCDSAGMKSVQKISQSLRSIASDIYQIELPYDIVKKDGKDVTDFFLQVGEDDFQKRFSRLMERAKTEEDLPDEGTDVKVNVLDSFRADLVGDPVEMRVAVSGRGSAPYQVPRKARYVCTQDASQNKCPSCPMATSTNIETGLGEIEVEIPPDDERILDLIDSPKKASVDLIREEAGATKCSRAWAEIDKWQAVEELFVRPPLDRPEDTQEYTSRKIYSVGRHDTQANRVVRAVGKIIPDPKSHRSEFLAWFVEQTETNVDSFEMTKEVHRRLKRFQPSSDQTPIDKMREIAQDLSDNVTRIYGRTDLHMAMDLVWHSAREFYFDGRLQPKGWLELLVLGDTRTGKSEVAQSLRQHYRAGSVTSCEAASFAGIVGGLQQYGGREWSLQWGMIPLNDRRLVVLDEVSGLSHGQISQMSSIRSRGEAEIIKIRTEKTSSRVRLIWLGNPRDGESMSNWLHGVQGIRPLIGNDEDIARFDMAMTVAKDEVSSDEINRKHTDPVPHVYTSDACNELVLWAWSRTADDIEWGRGAEDLVLRAAQWMGDKYLASPPLVQTENVRLKVARIAVAMAMRTYSSPDGTVLKVRREHVEDAVNFLHGLYSSKNFGYRELSQRAIEDQERAYAAMDHVQRYIKTSKNLEDFLRSRSSTFTRFDLEEMLGIDREQANAIISKLWNYRMVSKDDDGTVRMTPTLNQLLREM